MKKNVNLVNHTQALPRVFQDTKKIISCPVDNFPCDNPAYKKRDGFRCNDISLLDRLSFDQSFDPDLAKIVASRVKDYSSLGDKSNLTEEQMLRTLRPSWVQTAAEVKQWEEQVYQYLSTTADVKEEDVEAQVKQNDANNPVSDSSSPADDGSNDSKSE